MERKTFMNRFIKEIQIFPERQEDRRNRRYCSKTLCRKVRKQDE